MAARWSWWAVRCTKCRWGNDRRAADRAAATLRTCPKCGAPVSATLSIGGPGATGNIANREQ